MLRKEVLYSLDDVAITPADTSDIDHRSECNPYKEFNGKKFLPIFTAPMFNVVNKDTLSLYEDNNIIPILPRVNEEEMSILERVKLSERYWCAFGLDEFINNFSIGKTVGVHYVLVDIANGNMNKLIRSIKAAKVENPDLVIMAGNVANPKTYVALAYAGADYVRVSVGTGSVCTTASNLGIFYGAASLIQECFIKKLSKKLNAKIVADGGIKGSRYIIKALALGADYVMCGGLCNKALEAPCALYKLTSGPNDSEEYKLYLSDSKEFRTNKWTNESKKELITNGLYHQYYGMSTKKAQKEMGSTNLKTGEGKSTYNRVEYTLSGLVENLRDFIRSAMSYCGIKDINDFTPTDVETHLLSPTAAKAFND